MGILAQQMHDKAVADLSLKERQIDAWKLLLGAAQTGQAPPEHGDVALQELLKLTGHDKADKQSGGMLTNLIKRMIGKGGQPEQQAQDAGGTPAVQMPERQVMTRPPTEFSLPPIPGADQSTQNVLNAATEHPLPGVYEPTRSMFYTAAELGQRQAEFTEPGLRQKAALEMEQGKKIYAVNKARADEFAQTPAFKQMSPRQQTAVYLDMLYQRSFNVTPEYRPSTLPGYVNTNDILSSNPDATDAMGNALPKDSFARVRLMPDGTREYYVETGTTSGQIMPDKESPTGFSRVIFDRLGNEVSRAKGATPPAGYVPTTTTSQGVRFVPQPDNTIAAVPVTTTTTRQKNLPGGQGPANALPPVPGTQAQPAGQSAPAMRPGAGAGQPGNVVGGKPLPTPVKKDVGSVKQALRFAEQMDQILNAPGPNGEAPLSSRTAFDQQAVDWLKARVESAKYSTGIKSNDPVFQQMNPLASLLRVLVVSPYLRGLRNMMWVNQIEQHIPDPTQQTPAAMGTRLKVVMDALRGMKQDIMDQEGMDENRWDGLEGGPSRTGATKSVPGTVKLRAPDGTERDVPQSQVEHYVSKGAKVVK